jgi:oligopeptide/dipeptide ABC transporter ATP-binding protein
LSGGQQQRIAIAQAIVCGPALLVADEPTASLDPISQREIMVMLKRLQKDRGLAILFITHSPDLLAGFADRVAVMYGGRIVEMGEAGHVLQAARHPYTRALLRTRPSLEEMGEEVIPGRLPVIAGELPHMSIDAGGCIFEARCEDRMNVCRERTPALTNDEQEQEVACFKYGG